MPAGRTFRHDLSRDYKANRTVMPEEMAVQIPYIKQITAAYRLPVFEMAGYEADDLIGTFSRRLAQAGHPVVMVTGDKDFVQLVGERVSHLGPDEGDDDRPAARPGHASAWSRSGWSTSWGSRATRATTSRGCPGIGQKTALELIRTFGSLEGLYARVDEITRKKQKENLLQFREQAFLSRELARIRVDVPGRGRSAGALRRVAPDVPTLSELFRELEFRQLQQSLPRPERTAPQGLPHDSRRGRAGGPDRPPEGRRSGRASTPRRPPRTPCAPSWSACRSPSKTDRAVLHPVRPPLHRRAAAAARGGRAAGAEAGPGGPGRAQGRPEHQVRHDGAGARTGSSSRASCSTPCWPPTCSTPPSAPTTWTRSRWTSSTTAASPSTTSSAGAGGSRPSPRPPWSRPAPYACEDADVTRLAHAVLCAAHRRARACGADDVGRAAARARAHAHGDARGGRGHRAPARVVQGARAPPGGARSRRSAGWRASASTSTPASSSATSCSRSSSCRPRRRPRRRPATRPTWTC